MGFKLTEDEYLNLRVRLERLEKNDLHRATVKIAPATEWWPKIVADPTMPPDEMELRTEKKAKDTAEGLLLIILEIAERIGFVDPELDDDDKAAIARARKLLGLQ
jgi:hypothetical protein